MSNLHQPINTARSKCVAKQDNIVFVIFHFNMLSLTQTLILFSYLVLVWKVMHVRRTPMQRRSQDLGLGGGGGTRPMPPATFFVISGCRPDSEWGGGSSRNCPASPCADQIQWGDG